MPQLQFGLFDRDTGEVLAEGHTVACWGDGTDGGLASGVDEVLQDRIGSMPEHTTDSAAAREAWTGLPLPGSGDDGFADGLAPLSVDREAGVGSYWQPSVWTINR